ncbi:MAG TPA: response regulator [Bryobacteraceae bacterium]|nr:response regulator [Bryobacteraceae bacterium]
MREALEQHGVEGELVVIPDGDLAVRWLDALDSSSEACADLVILDLNLPKRAGRDVLQHVRKSVKCRSAVVVILSSSDTHQDQTEAMRLGASRYIKKPLRLAEFIQLGAVFREILETGRSSGGAAN